MIEVRQSAAFRTWMAGLKDVRARVRIGLRLDRLAEGNPGDARSVGEGVSELRIDYGPGYRVYFTRRGELLVVLLSAATNRARTKTSARPRRSPRT